MEGKKYYYMKLKGDFFDTDTMIYMESMKNGYLYQNILLKLYLRSLNTGGEVDAKVASPAMIATLTRHKRSTVESALKIFKELGLISVKDNDGIIMEELHGYIGTGSSDSDRVKAYNECKKLQKNYTEITQYKEIEKEIDIEIDIDKEKDKEKAPPKRFAPPTTEEVKAYCEEINAGIDPQHFIDYYSSQKWKKANGQPLTDWKAAVRLWKSKEKPKEQKKQELVDVGGGEMIPW